MVDRRCGWGQEPVGRKSRRFGSEKESAGIVGYEGSCGRYGKVTEGGRGKMMIVREIKCEVG